MTTTPAPAPQTDTVVSHVLQAWQKHVDAHDADAVAAVFTRDALFQGLRPTHSTGRDGVRAYYAAQPLGMKVTYQVLSTRAVSDSAIAAFARLTFDFPDGHTIPVHLTAVVEQHTDRWQISHYHVSRIEA
ncbi:SgcJ/EcaC family oxidoreductase [Cellulosimicrobium cellulans]|uniref:SgcJ/EcaC family oxidoreductase n=1 Tax=Cellulosimicrobium cellulans TaxID=1710 RepID=UPI0036E0ED6E